MKSARRTKARGGVERQTAGLRVNRRQEILDAAAKYFKEKGYAAASMREIADHAQVQTASLYYHFPSKSELLLAVYEESALQLVRTVEEAIAGVRDPWRRLEVACATHLTCLLQGSDYVQVVISDVPESLDDDLRRKLIAQRDSYEAVFRRLMEALPLKRSVEPKFLLLSLLGAMAWTRVWFRPGGDSPAAIAGKMVALFREGAAG